MKKHQLWLSLFTTLSATLMLGLIIVGFLIVQFSRDLPDANSIKSVQLKVPLRVFSADGQLISEFGNERRKPLEYAEFSPTIIDAVLAAEDDGFFAHGGIDVFGLIRAALANVRSGSSGQGASTITMQVARNFFLTRDKTYTRKIKEILLSLRLEQLLSKEEILSLYLNKIFLGHRSYGFGAAAETYYGKPLDELSVAQTAMLAGLPKAPSAYNPLRNPERAKIRRDYVLGRMLATGKLSEQEYQNAIAAEISAEKHLRSAEGLNAPHVAEMVRAKLTEDFGQDAYWQGLNVYTTIRGDLQSAAQASLRTGLQKYDRRHGFRGAIARIDLQALRDAQAEAENSSLDAVLENALAQYPSSGDQQPAVVLSSGDQSAQLWTVEYGEQTLDLKYAGWAKRHKTANLVGDKPQKMSDVVSQGDVVYVKPVVIEEPETTPTDTTTAPEEPETTVWELTQIPNVGGALISMDPQSGQILSLVGGYDFFLNKYNRATQSIRQPGSNIKPFIYSAAIDRGFTPASLISGAPIVITDPAHGTLWRPENYSGKFYGPTRMREALGKSMNLVSIRLLRAIGVPFARRYLQRFGIDMNRFSASLTMALGAGGVTPLEMLSSYSVLANGGYRIEPYFIERIEDRNGEVIYAAPSPEFCDQCYAEFLEKPLGLEEFEAQLEPIEEELLLADDIKDESADQEMVEQQSEQADLQRYSAPRVMSRGNNFLTVSMMKDVIQRGTARKALVLKRTDLAGKTGTTNDYVDAWFTGFNRQIATTVWIGFDDPQTMGKGEAGSLAALPIWVDYMAKALVEMPMDEEQTPEFVEQISIDRSSAREVPEDTPGSMNEYRVIPELTPEHSLLLEKFPNLALMQAAIQAAGDESLDLDSEQPMTPTLDVDAQGQRIIEEDDDTEGLF